MSISDEESWIFLIAKVSFKYESIDKFVLIFSKLIKLFSKYNFGSIVVKLNDKSFKFKNIFIFFNSSF